MLNMFRMLIHPSSGACDLFVELFHGFYYSGSMYVGVTLWFGWSGVVWFPYAGFSLHTDTTPPQPYHNVTPPTHIEPYTTHEVTQRISRKLLRMAVLTSETCWALNKVTIKQVTSSWSLFTQLGIYTLSNRRTHHQPANPMLWDHWFLLRNCDGLLSHILYNQFNGNNACCAP